jgi:hypothetical protein
MSKEDEAARQARAKRLRAEADALTGARPPEETESVKQPAESPREFIHRRMKEIEEEEKRGSGEGKGQE